MKKVIITTITLMLVTFAINVSAANEIKETYTPIVSNKTTAYRWVATMANDIKYTVIMIVNQDNQMQNYISIKAEKFGEQISFEDLPVAPGASNISFYLSEDHKKMSVYYYADGPVTVDIEDL